jgi:hypothetical protein
VTVRKRQSIVRSVPPRLVRQWRMADDAVVLYRPVGAKELELIRASGFTAFPPRLPGQPIFYPVTNEAYAAQIARDWNTKDEASGHRGYVTRFRVLSDFMRRFTPKQVGAEMHQEYWIPAEDLHEMNSNIAGLIEVIAEFPQS